MKLIIQVPCYNEAQTLPATLQALPRTVAGFDAVEWLVIDDGSTDGTADVARRCGVDHVVRFAGNRGLARAFAEGLDACLEHGADVIVNTDGDNQYDASCVPELVAPILRGEADVVLGDRPIDTIEDFSRLKRRLQRVGSRVVRCLSGVDLSDAVTGFRALSREAALRLNVLTDFTYTVEMLFQVGDARLAVVHVPIRTNPRMRSSRLARSMGHYLAESLKTIVRVYTFHRPLRVFGWAGAVPALLGLLLSVRYLVLTWWLGEGKGHVQSVIIAALLLNIAVVLWMLGLLADATRANRLSMEKLLYRVRKLEPPRRAAPADEPDGE